MLKFAYMILKNLTRNKLRTVLTFLAVNALVAVFSLIVTVLLGIEEFTKEKGGAVQLMVSDKYNMMMPFPIRHLNDIVMPGGELNQKLQTECDFDPSRYTFWHFVFMSLDKDMKDKDLLFPVVATLPDKVPTMMFGIKPGDVDPRAIELMRSPPRSGLKNSGIVMGETIMKKLKKNVGDHFKAWSLSHRKGTGMRDPLEMEFEIVATLPEDHQWNGAAFVDWEFLKVILQNEQSQFDGRINNGFLEFKDKVTAERAALLIEKENRELRVETLATAFSRFMAPLEGMLWWVKWILVPAIVIVMTLILANTFSITIRERTAEMAVLKVLGFSSTRILVLVLGEALLVGVLSGLAGAFVTYAICNWGLKGIPMQDNPRIMISSAIFWWGPVLGMVTAVVGGIWPALSARAVNVSQAFASAA
jgi:putative ABC transport system permease protein